MIASLANITIFDKPLIFYSGILTLLLLLLTASIGYATVRGIKWLPFKYHPFMAKITVIMALVHGLMGFSIYFKF